MQNQKFTLNGSVLNVIALLVSVVGLILGIVMGNTMGSISSLFSRSSSEFNSMAMIIVWLITAIIVICFLWMGAILNRLESIDNKLGCNTPTTENSGSTPASTGSIFGSNVAPIFNDNESGAYQSPRPAEREAGPGEWKCKNCGKINSNYVGTCGCGQQQLNNH